MLIRDGQLCRSNPAVISLLAENLRQEYGEKPECNYWSVSQNDCINYCECEHCQDLYSKYGSISGAYLNMANQIGRQFPAKRSQPWPTSLHVLNAMGIVPEPNVKITFCSIECNRTASDLKPTSASLIL